MVEPEQAAHLGSQAWQTFVAASREERKVPFLQVATHFFYSKAKGTWQDKQSIPFVSQVLQPPKQGLQVKVVASG